MPYEFREDIAHADIAFNAWGESLEELFAAAAEATLNVMVDDISAVRPSQTLSVHVEQSDPEMLLFDFLNELIFYKDARRLLLRPSQINVVSDGERFTLEAAFQGEEISPERHRLNTDVKAVTMHRFSVRQEEGLWRATVVLDV